MEDIRAGISDFIVASLLREFGLCLSNHVDISTCADGSPSKADKEHLDLKSRQLSASAVKDRSHGAVLAKCGPPRCGVMQAQFLHKLYLQLNSW